MPYNRYKRLHPYALTDIREHFFFFPTETRPAYIFSQVPHHIHVIIADADHSLQICNSHHHLWNSFKHNDEMKCVWTFDFREWHSNRNVTCILLFVWNKDKAIYFICVIVIILGMYKGTLGKYSRFVNIYMLSSFHITNYSCLNVWLTKLLQKPILIKSKTNCVL